MALLTAGYWQTTYWPENYWADDYWPEYGLEVAEAEVAAGRGKWTLNPFIDDLDFYHTTDETSSDVTEDTTLTDVHDVVFVDASSGEVKITMMASADMNRKVYIKKIDSSDNKIKIDGNGTETVEDEEYIYLTDQYESVTLSSDGTEIFIV